MPGQAKLRSAASAPYGKSRKQFDQGWREASGEVSAYLLSGLLDPALAREAVQSQSQRCRKRHPLEVVLDQVSRWIRKTCNLPLSPWVPTAS